MLEAERNADDGDAEQNAQQTLRERKHQPDREPQQIAAAARAAAAVAALDLVETERHQLHVRNLEALLAPRDADDRATEDDADQRPEQRQEETAEDNPEDVAADLAAVAVSVVRHGCRKREDGKLKTGWAKLKFLR